MKSPTSAKIMAAMRESQPGNGGNGRMQLIHNGLDLFLNLSDLSIQFTDETDSVLQFKGLGGHSRANGASGNISDFQRHIPFVVAFRGGFEK